MDYIAELRKHDGASGDDIRTSDVYEEIEGLLYLAKAYEVDSTFTEGGRWSNFKTIVYLVDTLTGQAYFALWQRVPATECQDDDEFEWEFNEVQPREITTTIYE